MSTSKSARALIIALATPVLAMGITGGGLHPAGAAESLEVENLPADTRQFRSAVEQVVRRVDTVINQLKPKAGAEAVVLDLMQTRDNLMREMPKLESNPGDAKWDASHVREGVEDMLKLIKDQYEKASEHAG